MQNYSTTPPMAQSPRRRTRKLTPVMWVLVAAFLLMILITSCLTFLVVREFILEKTSAPAAVSGPVLTTSEPVENPNIDRKTPLQMAGPTPQPWNGAERVNVLVMGLDFRDWEGGGPARTDTMILFTMDPQAHTAGMLSIPRDLWVNIPGYYYGKINTAYYLGELDQLPGGGPALAIQTVENLLGVTIHYYAQVDFNSFVEFIDLIGGINIEISEEITVDPIGPGNTVTLDAGVQHLDGATALAYARNRDTLGGDFDRSQRQQQVMMAVRQQVLDMNMMPLLVQKSPLIYQQIAGGLNTNLTLDEVIQLAWSAIQVDPEAISQGAIGPDQVTITVSPDGLDILLPDTDAVRQLRDEIFNVGASFEPQINEGDLKTLVATEAATISVLNATYTAGLAAETGDFLKNNGLNVASTGNAQDAADLTSIIDYTGNPYTNKYLAQVMQIDPSRIFIVYDANSLVDISITLGADWANQNPMP